MTTKEMKARLREIQAEAAKLPEGESEKLTALLNEAEEIYAKLGEASDRARLQKIADDSAGDLSGAGESGESGDEIKDAAKKRGEALMQGKRVKFKNALTSESTVLTHHTAEDVKPTFNDISSLVDRVRIISLPGGETYTRGFEKSNGEGAYTEESADYNTIEPSFGYASITKTKITAYCEEPEEITKLSPSGYDSVIGSSCERAIRKYLSKQILTGEGGAGKLCGIFYNPTLEKDDIIDRKTDIAISEIDANTLDEIIYSYGGDEEVEDVAVLILNKADLKKFATLRNTDGTKVYSVVNNGNTGTIDGIPYIISSACKAISGDSSDDDYCMAYGLLSNYELAVFSDMDVQRSTEYKFKQGQIAHRADIFVGGNVAAYNGFLRVKKKSQ